jgi:hypothetical protein
MKRFAQAFFLAAFFSMPVIAAPEYQYISIEDCTLAIEWRGEFSPEQKGHLTEWLITVMTTTSLLYGELPREEIRIVLQPYAGRGAVPFARILREQPEGVLFYVDPDEPLSAFVEDWTAYHELSHLFIPYPGYRDIWFSEGLASYYQNVLQGRAKLLTRDEAAAKLAAGFERGKNDDSHALLTLGELGPVMREKRAFMRVYWSGALYFLTADITLRRLPPDDARPRTLDGVLREFAACCLMQPRDWTGMAIAAEFDRIAATNLFTTLYRQFELSRTLPEPTEMLAAKELDAILAPQKLNQSLAVQ